MIDQIRVDRIKTSLAEAGLDALILRLPENIVMSCGCWPMNGFSYAVVTAGQGPAALIAPSCEDEEMSRCWAKEVRYFPWPRLNMPDPMLAVQSHLREAAKTLGIERGRIGYEGSFDAVAPAHNSGEVLVPNQTTLPFFKQTLSQATFVDATRLLYELRAVKTPNEIEKLRRAHQVAGYGIEAFLQGVAPGITEAALASEGYRAVLSQGVALPEV